MGKPISSKKIELKYFSRFAELTAKTSEEFKTEADNVESLWLELEGIYSFEQPLNTIRPAINHQFCDWQTKISDGDTVSFIPPVSGG